MGAWVEKQPAGLSLPFFDPENLVTIKVRILYTRRNHLKMIWSTSKPAPLKDLRPLGPDRWDPTVKTNLEERGYGSGWFEANVLVIDEFVD